MDRRKLEAVLSHGGRMWNVATARGVSRQFNLCFTVHPPCGLRRTLSILAEKLRRRGDRIDWRSDHLCPASARSRGSRFPRQGRLIQPGVAMAAIECRDAHRRDSRFEPAIRTTDVGDDAVILAGDASDGLAAALRPAGPKPVRALSGRSRSNKAGLTRSKASRLSRQRGRKRTRLLARTPGSQSRREMEKRKNAAMAHRERLLVDPKPEDRCRRPDAFLGGRRS